MARTGIDFHTSFQSHPISGWLFYLPLDLGAGRRGCGHPQQQRQAEAQASASAYGQAVDRVGGGAVRSCRAGRQREHERHRRFRLAVRRRDARGGRGRGHREDHGGWRLREPVLAKPDRLDAADRQGLRRLPLRGRRQRHRRGQPLSQPVQRLCGPMCARVGLGVQRELRLGQRRLGAPVGQPSVFSYQGLAHRVRAGTVPCIRFRPTCAPIACCGRRSTQA